MSISSIGSSSYYQTQMSTIGNRSSPQEMFNKIDQDGSGDLDQTEFSVLAEKISEATGQEVDVEELFATYDADGDGVLNQEETDTAMEANRPQGPPPEMMAGMQGPPPDFSVLFNDADSDESGSLDSSEVESVAEMISQATGTDIGVEELIASFDEDEDGLLNEDETMAALEANRPQGPPPPPPKEQIAASEESDSATTFAIENYLKVAAMGMGQSDLSALLSGTEGADALGTLLSVNTSA